MTLRISVLLLWALSLGSTLAAQHYPLRGYGVEDGLPQTDVMGIVEDADGYLWISTGAGLARFDGLTFETFSNEDGLPSNLLRGLALADDGTLWVTSLHGLAIRDGVHFEPVASEEIGNTWHIALDGEVPWVSDGTTGLKRYDDGRVRTLTEANGLPSDTVRAMTTSGGAAWALTAGGLVRLADGRMTLIAPADRLPLHPVALAPTHDGSVWVLGAASLARIDLEGGLPASVLLRPFPAGEQIAAARSIATDALRRVWIGTEAGQLIRFDATQPGLPITLRLSPTNGLPEAPIERLHISPTGQVWMGPRAQGIWMIPNEAFAHFDEANGLSDPIVWYVTEIGGTMWAGTNSGLYRLGENKRFTRVPLPLKTDVNGILPHPKGGLWLGTGAGLLHYQPTGRTRLYTEADGLASSRVFVLLEGAEGTLWIGTDEGVTRRLADGTMASWTEAEGLPNALVTDMTFDASGTLWVATDAGIARFVDGTMEPVETGHDDLAVNAIVTMPDGSVWGGFQDRGLVEYTPEHPDTPVLHPFTGSLRGATTYSLSAGPDGYLWAGTNRGIARFTATTSASGEALPFTLYDASRGFLAVETNQGPAYWDDEGRFWVGTPSGLTVFDPSALPQAWPPRLHLRALNLGADTDWHAYADSTDARGLPVGLRLPTELNFLSLSFTGIDFGDPEGLRYQYGLATEGAALPDEWSPLVSNNTATFPNLAPGWYTFHVRAQTTEGVWTPRSETFTFSIAPPFWQTGWFLAFMTIATLAIGLGSYRWRTARYRAHQQELKRAVEQRTAELRQEKERVEVTNLQLAETNAALDEARTEALIAVKAKSDFLATMSHEIRTPLNGVIGMTSHLLDTRLSSEQSEFVSIIRSSGQGLLAIINDVLDFSKIEAGMLDLEVQPFDLHTCCEDALDLVMHRAAEKQIDLHHASEETVPRRVMGDATRLRQIIVNLLSNAVKFTEEGEVVLSTHFSNDETLHLTVRDTGIGIEPHRLEHLFEEFTQADTSTTRRFGGTGLGLAIVKRLTEAMGGEVWATSEPGVGTTFHVALPLGILSEEACEDPSPAALTGRRVLIAYPNATGRKALCQHLEAWEAEAIAVASTQEALAQLQGQDALSSFDLALIDYDLVESHSEPLVEGLREHGCSQAILLHTVRDAPGPLRGIRTETLLKPAKSEALYRTVMSLLFPGALAPCPTGTSVAALAPLPVSLRVLVAEDNRVNQRVVGLALERMGAITDMVADGQEALDALRYNTYDVVLMDVRMPRIDGLEATGRLRADTALAQPVILAMTADVTTDMRDACLAAGMDGFLAKPVDHIALHDALREIAERHSGTAARQSTTIRTTKRPEAAAASAGPPSAGGAEPAFGHLYAQTANNHALYHSLLADMRTSLAEEVAQIGPALREEDLKRAGRAAHSAKALSGLLGLADLTARTRTIEHACDGGRLDEAVAALLPLTIALTDSLALIDAELAMLAQTSASQEHVSPRLELREPTS